MGFLGDLFNLILLAPMINLTVFLIRLFEASNIPGALGFAIITLTALIAGITWPFRNTQIRTTKHTSEQMVLIKPKLAILKERHKNDKMAFAQAQSALMKEHGINPTAGCLPALIPIIIIFPLYQVFLAFVGGQDGINKINYFLYTQAWHINNLPDPNFFGLNLAAKPSDFVAFGAVLLLVPIISTALTFVQSKMMAPKPLKEYPNDSSKEKKEKAKEEDAMAAMQTQMIIMMPVMIGVFAFTLPVALSLYWNVLTVFNIYQQYKVAGWGGFEDIINKGRGLRTKG